MASEVKTNKISPATSTTINVGDSGDTLALATDAVTGFQVGSDVRGDILFRDATDYTRLAAGTSGDFLKTQGAGADPVWASAGGLAGAYTWRMESDYTTSGTTGTVLGNSVVWDLDDTEGYVSIGSTGSEASGVFTFGATGIWKCDLYCSLTIGGTAPWELVTLQTSIDTGSAWTSRSQGAMPVHNGEYCSGTVSCIFDVENTTTHLFRVWTVSGSGDFDVVFQGDANINYTYVNFTKLGAT